MTARRVLAAAARALVVLPAAIGAAGVLAFIAVCVLLASLAPGGRR